MKKNRRSRDIWLIEALTLTLSWLRSWGKPAQQKQKLLPQKGQDGNEEKQKEQ